MTRSIAGLAAALALPILVAGAGAAAAAEARSLTVTGQANAGAKPDMAMVTAGVVTQAPTAAAALADNSKATAGVIDSLKGDGIEPRDLQTANFSLQPVYVYPRADDASSGPPRVTGYTVSNTVQVRVRDLAKLGAVLDKAIAAGANSVSGVDFIVSKQSELLDGARRSAVEDARRKAALYAEAAGAKLGPVMTLSEQASAFPPPRPMYRMDAAAAASVPIEAGETTLRVEITATYALE